MMKNRPIRLSEARLHQIIRKNIRKALTEGMTSDNPAYDKWETIKDTIGSDKMLEDIFNYLDSSMLEQLVEWFDQDYELFDNEEDY